MSDPRIPKFYHRTTPHWQQEQRNAFWELNENKREGSAALVHPVTRIDPPIDPPFNTRPDKLEAHAEESLSINGRLYAQSNAGQGWSMRL
jgi:hypothetical protein